MASGPWTSARRRPGEGEPGHLKGKALTRLVGGHVSAAGGIKQAVERGDSIGASVIQIFSNSPRSWKAAPIALAGFAGFDDAIDATGSGVRRVVSHVSYLVNIASPDPELYERSVRVLRETLVFCGSIGVSAAVLHVGSHRGTGFSARLGAISDAINGALAESRSVKLLLENSAGAGDSVGSSFAELAAIIGTVDEAYRMGVCLDTQHLFAAGCDYRDAPSTAAARIADELPAGSVQAIHLNDSKVSSGSHLDRHENLGAGNIGVDALSAFIREEPLAGADVILETPGDGNGPRREDVDLARGMVGLA